MDQKQTDANFMLAARRFQAALLSAHLSPDIDKSVDLFMEMYVSTAQDQFGRLAIELATSGIRRSGILVGKENRYYEHGRRMFATVVATKLGTSSVDEVLEAYIPEKIDRAWPDLAEKCFKRAKAPLEAVWEYPVGPSQRDINFASIEWSGANLRRRDPTEHPRVPQGVARSENRPASGRIDGNQRPIA